MHVGVGVDKPKYRRNLTEEQIATARVQAMKGPADLADLLGSDRRTRIANRLRKFDHDSDGVIQKEDIPSRGRLAFDRVDRNQDGRIDAAEMDEFVSN
jgi:hypothetical protein